MDRRDDHRRLQAADQHDLLQALIGVPMAADFFGRTLAACEFPTGSRAIRTIGAQWARFPLTGGSVYAYRANATEPGDTLQLSWRIDYHDVGDGFPLRSVLITSDGRVDLQLKLAQVDIMFRDNDDVRFKIDMPSNSPPLQPKQLRRVIYGG